MLTIQPKFSTNYKPAFRANDDTIEFTDEDRDYVDDYLFENEETYNHAKEELEEQRDTFENLSKDKDLNIPKPAQKILKGGAVVTGGILGGMATGWGTKKSIEGFKALNKTKAVVSMKKSLNTAYHAIKEEKTSIWEKFKASKLYTSVKTKLTEKGTKFANSKIGKPITDAYKTTKNFVGNIYKKIKSGATWVINKIKGVKKETYEKVTVNTVGVSGGVASGVTTLKEQDEKGKE